MTFDEMVQAITEAKIPGSRTAVWRFLDRHGITVKRKFCTQRGRSELIAPATRRRWQCEQGMFDPAHLVFVDGVLQRQTERR